MRALDRKLLRDLLGMKGPALAIISVVAAGIAVFVASLSALDSLDLSRQAYYEDYRFADVFAGARRAPAWVARRIGEIPGVVAVEDRVVADVTLDVEGVTEPVTARLISMPEGRRPRLNDVHVRAGRGIEPGFGAEGGASRPGAPNVNPAREDEALLSEAFAAAHGIGPGDSVTAVVNGRRRRFVVAGTAISPEYVYQISGKDPWPDDKRFAVLWMGREALAAALDMRGAFNDVSLSLAPARWERGAGSREADVIADVYRLLAPYGGIGAYGRDRQISARFLADELTQLRGTALIIPSIFLGVAAFLLNVVVSRLISTQRTQIATLKAFGYSSAAIGAHYLEMALSLVLAGAAVGTAAGLWLGRGMTRLYADYFHFPVLELRVTASTAALGLLISVAAAAAGVAVAVRRAAALPPAEAMRPEAPATFKPTLLERLGLHRLLSPAARMIARSVARRPVRAALSAASVALAVAILVVGRFTEDAIGYMMDLHFRLAQGEDATVLFVEPRPRAALVEIAHMPGVLRAEPLRAAPVTLRAGHRSRRAAVTGMPAGGALHRLVDRDGRALPLPPEGLALGAYLAEELGVGLGDAVTVEVLEGRRSRREVPVTLIVDELVGASATMEIGALNRLIGEGDTVSGAYLDVDPRLSGPLYEELKRTPLVAGVSVRQAALDSFERTLEESLGTMRAVQVVFAVIIAFSVVYNNARIALAERSRELASLRVLGFTRAEVSLVLLGELSVTTLAAIPLGLGLGRALAWAFTEGYQTEMFRMPFVIERSTYAYAALVVLLAAALSALLVRRRIDRLDLVGVLKSRD
ncbi:MAG: FtsX-like permease family protein [Polyangiaceae bacterium]|nr:FtsX-like permease family protein [Polyangiaceae bacterium]